MVSWWEDAPKQEVSRLEAEAIVSDTVFEVEVPDTVFQDILRALPADILAEYMKHVAGMDVGPEGKGPELTDLRAESPDRSGHQRG